jgi:hypothetical protein
MDNHPLFFVFRDDIVSDAIHLPGEENGTERRIGKEVMRDEEKTVPDHDDACSPDSDYQLRNNR